MLNHIHDAIVNSDFVLTFFAIIKKRANYAHRNGEAIATEPRAQVGAATRTHRKISSVMSQIKIQVILFLYLFLNYFIHYSGPFQRKVS